jgi:hypothetical protein
MKEQTVGGPSEIFFPAIHSDSPEIRKTPTDASFLQATTTVFDFIPKKRLNLG